MSQLRKKTRKKRVRPKHSKALKQIQEDLLCVLSTVANGRGLFVFTLLALMRTPPHTASKPSPKVKARSQLENERQGKLYESATISPAWCPQNNPCHCCHQCSTFTMNQSSPAARSSCSLYVA